MDIPKVKPCPFCGKAVYFYLRQGTVYAVCENECVIFNHEIEYETHEGFRRLPRRLAKIDSYEAGIEKAMSILAEKWNQRPHIDEEGD